MRSRCIAFGLAVLPWIAPVPSPAAEGDLAERVEVLTEEVRRLRERMAIPDTDEELAGRHGLAPAASRVYGKSGLSIGGYGEATFAQPLGDGDAPRRADFFRFIAYFGYKFSDRVVMNTEIEIEHGTTSANFEGREGSVSVEFGYLDFLLSPGVNVRAGTLLLPAGFVNRLHEPPAFRGNLRPLVETRLIPTTWREIGAGVHGEPAEGFRYEAYVVNGPDAMGFDGNGIRGGRQKGNRVLFEDAALVLSAELDPPGPWSGGGSLHVGQADQSRDFDGGRIDATVTVREGHVELRRGPFRGRALVAVVGIGDAGAISRELSASPGDVVVPERQLGWYVEGSWNVAPWVGIASPAELLAWARFERLDLHREVPAGLTADPARDARFVTFGLELKPLPAVVVKADVTVEDTEAGGETEDPLRLGIGFLF